MHVLSFGENNFYIQHTRAGKANRSNVVSLNVEDIEDHKTYYSDIQALYNISLENKDKSMFGEFKFDAIGRPIELKELNWKITFSEINGKKRVTKLNISATEGVKKISSLDEIKGLTALTELLCINNDLKNLDVSNNKKLRTLLCSSNQLKTLTIGENKELVTLLCDHNELTILDCSNNINLKDLGCENNLFTPKSVSILNSFFDHQGYTLTPNKNSPIYDIVTSIDQSL